MTKKLRIIIPIIVALLIAGALFFFLRPKTNDPREIPNAGDLYETAAASVSAMEALSYRITETKAVTSGRNTLTEQSVRDIRTRMGSQGITQYFINETLSFGTHQIAATELYTGDCLFLTVEGGQFSAPIPGDGIEQRVTPALLLTPSLYATISGYETDGIITVQYTDCSAVEAWLGVTGATAISASGAVRFDKTGNIIKIVYQVSYQSASRTFRHSFVCENIVQDNQELPANTAPEAYTRIDDARTLKALERASGYLLSAETVGTAYTGRISCQVFGDVREQAISLQINAINDWTAQMTTSATLSNTTKAGASTTVLQSETFKNGVYTVSTNGGIPVEKAEITGDIMKKHCSDLLVGTIALPNHITSVAVTESPDTIHFEFAVSEEFARILQEEMCQILYQNPGLFSQYEEGYTTDLAKCKLTVDAHTGLPLASGFQFRGSYTIDGLAYALEYAAEQVYTYSPT